MRKHSPFFLINTFLAICFIAQINAQNNKGFWSIDKQIDLDAKDIKFYKSKPKYSSIINLDIEGLRDQLLSVPKRALSSKSDGLILNFPNQKGKTESFLVQEASVMEPGLQRKYPEIRSFIGKGIDNPSSILRFSMSPEKGFSGMILSGGKTVFIEPYTEDLRTYISFVNSQDDNPRPNFTCGTEYIPSDFDISDEDFLALRNANDGTLRTYRLALACTVEYAQFHGGTVASVLAAMNTTMTRVNGVFERDLGLTMVIVDDNEDVIFLGPDVNSDPYTNNSGGVMLGQNQATCDLNIGSANYDIGHVFSTGGGGIAQLRSPCTPNKARGVTGLPSPIGDAFDIDFVAHEMGHQYGGNHTQNNNCQRSGVSVEPGSASTIMGYAGICAPNVQNNSDDYFHGENIKEMWNNIFIGPSSTCFTGSATNNVAPVVDAGSDFSIPISTAFVLRGSATDADTASGLTYCWEQIDATPSFMPPQSFSSTGPAFRSLDPSESTDRYMPQLSTVMSGSLATTWEVIPSVGRTMNFSLTVRDNELNGGATESDEMVVTVESPTTPFTVDTPSSWPSNSNQQVTWVVGQTNTAPINCQNVNILFTTNDGASFVTLASNVPNTGTANVEAPSIPNTTNAKVLVEAADNIFYAVSSSFSITDPLSIDENEFENLSIYPNPNDGNFNISFSPRSGENIGVEIYDIRGRKVYSSTYEPQGQFEEKIKVDYVQSGIYLLRISDGSQKVTKKIIVD